LIGAIEPQAFSPVNRRLVARLEGSTVHAYDIDTGIEVYRLLQTARPGTSPSAATAP
jgi:hypothetical protein